MNKANHEEQEGDSHQFFLGGTRFIVPNYMKPTQVLGRGGFGVVVGATDTRTGTPLAVKKIVDAFGTPIHGKRLLREIRIMKFLNHRNILSIKEVLPPKQGDFNEVYLVLPRMVTSLKQAIALHHDHFTLNHHRYIMYQILLGVRHMHSAGLIHRDLKPSNVLINADCSLKICDFGLSRGAAKPLEPMTQYVVTRYYRAPEIMLGEKAYDRSIDMWSVGCIFGQLLSGEPLFTGVDYMQMLRSILAFLGTPSEEELSFVTNPRARRFVDKLPRYEGVELGNFLPDAPPEALDLLRSLLRVDPRQRCTVEEALAHPFLSPLQQEEEGEGEEGSSVQRRAAEPVGGEGGGYGEDGAWSGGAADPSSTRRHRATVASGGGQRSSAAVAAADAAPARAAQKQRQQQRQQQRQPKLFHFEYDDSEMDREELQRLVRAEASSSVPARPLVTHLPRQRRQRRRQRQRQRDGGVEVVQGPVVLFSQGSNSAAAGKEEEEKKAQGGAARKPPPTPAASSSADLPAVGVGPCNFEEHSNGSGGGGGSSQDAGNASSGGGRRWLRETLVRLVGAK